MAEAVGIGLGPIFPLFLKFLTIVIEGWLVEYGSIKFIRVLFAGKVSCLSPSGDCDSWDTSTISQGRSRIREWLPNGEGEGPLLDIKS
jgi:hypothetical protein